MQGQIRRATRYLIQNEHENEHEHELKPLNMAHAQHILNAH